MNIYTYILLFIHTLAQYCSGDQIKKNGMGGAFRKYGGEERCIQGFCGEPEGKRPLGRPKRRRDDNVKMDVQEVGCGVMDWNDQAHYRDRRRALVNAVMNFLVP
jgi:hypothetical protein